LPIIQFFKHFLRFSINFYEFPQLRRSKCGASHTSPHQSPWPTHCWARHCWRNLSILIPFLRMAIRCCELCCLVLPQSVVLFPSMPAGVVRCISGHNFRPSFLAPLHGTYSSLLSFLLFDQVNSSKFLLNRLLFAVWW